MTERLKPDQQSKDTMSWHDIVGHREVIDRIQRAVLRRRIAGAYLFVGPSGVGKATIARKLAQTLLCNARSRHAAEPCGICAACVQVAARTHPDLDVIARSDERAVLSIELFVGDRSHRNQEGLCHRIALKPFHSAYRVAIIDDADDLSLEGANVLLKTLEEPPPYAVIILIATSLSRQLPTVRSRCQTLFFQALQDEEVAFVLRSRFGFEESRRLEQLVRLARGSVRTALELAESDLLVIRNELLPELIRVDWNPVAVSERVLHYLDRSTKESLNKRRILRHLIQMTADLYRHLLRKMATLPSSADELVEQLAQEALASGRFDWRALLECLDACLEADQAAQSHAHLPTLVDAWLDRLAEAAPIYCKLK